jgi:translation initiation factor 5B
LDPTFNKGEDGEDLGGLMALLGKGKKNKPKFDDDEEEVVNLSSKKKKGKKKKQDEDQEDAAEILARIDGEEQGAEVAPAKKQGKKGKKRQDYDDEDAAELLARLDEQEQQESEPASVPAPKKNQKKGKKKQDYDDEDAAELLARLDAQETETPSPSKKSTADDTEVIHDEQTSASQKKGKKGKKNEEEEESPVAAEPEVRIKSKKEKEKERKERQKQQQKKQQQKVVLDVPNEEPVVASDSQSKPKGKGGKAPNAAIAALREAMAAKRAAEEERIRLEQERIAKEEEEKRQQEELERQKEEARRLKKEKEKAKREELKKQGKLLTPAQKAAEAKRKAQLDALLASGVIVAGLQEKQEGQKPKKVVYSNRKKKPNQKKQDAGSAVESTAPSVASEEPRDTWDEEEEVTPVQAPPPVPEEKEDVKDAWDAESDDNVKDTWDAESDENVKDAWDADSDDEKPAKVVKPAPKKPEPKAVAKPTASEPKTVAKTASKAVVQPVKKPEPEEEEEESSEEESSEEESEEETESEEESDEEISATEKQAIIRKQEAAKRREERIAASYAARSKDNLRSPICVIMGHVDTGKTKLLDKIRQTNVQEGEAGGITQQIGATYFPIDAVEEKTKMIHKGQPSGYKLPGLLVIDTPGHESFSNLRSRGSSLCNIAVLVVDIVHGLEPQTIESLNMLRDRKTPFIVALNKIDRLFDWKTHADYPTRETLALQKPSVLSEFEDRVTKTIVQFAEQGLNACLYWENKNMGRNVSLVPTSAITGEGVPDLLHLLMDLTQTRMTERLMYLSELECTVLEVKVIEGLGTTIDVVLSNGVLNEGDRICVCGLNGPIVTTIRALLTPQPLRELRVKSAYQHHKSIKAAMGVKIAAPDLEKAIAGARLLVIGPDDDEDDIKEEVMSDLTSLLQSIDRSGKGVCVQASTLGSLEALLTFLKQMNIPVSGINIGPVHKKDIIRASVMLERCPEYAQMLAFDVPIDKDAEMLAQEMGVRIFTANIIYHLFDKFTAYMKELEEQKRKDAMPSAVFPCLLRMVPDAIFNKRAPIIIGVDVVEGTLKIGTPLCVVNEVFMINLARHCS